MNAEEPSPEEIGKLENSACRIASDSMVMLHNDGQRGDGVNVNEAGL